MASLKSGWVRGIRGAALAGADLLGQRDKERRAQEEWNRQQTLRHEQQQALTRLQYDLAGGNQAASAQRQAEQQRRQALVSLLDKAGAGEDTSSLVQQVLSLGGTPEDVDAIVGISEGARRTKEEERQRLRLEQAEDKAFFDPNVGANVIRLPSGEVRQIDPTGAQVGQQKVDELGVSGDALARQTGREAHQRAINTPQLAGGMNPITGDPAFAWTSPGGATQPVEGLVPKPTGGVGGEGGPDGNTQARVKMATSLLNAFQPLTEKINTAQRPFQLVEGARRWAGQYLGDTDAELFTKLRGPLAATTMSAISGAQAADAERRTFQSLMSGFSTSESVSRAVMATVREMLTEVSQGGQEIPPDEVYSRILSAATNQTESDINVSAEDLLREP